MGFPMAVQVAGGLLTRLPRSVSVSVTENGLALMHEAHLETFGSNKNGCSPYGRGGTRMSRWKLGSMASKWVITLVYPIYK